VLMVWGNPLLKLNQVRCDPKKQAEGPSICSRTQRPHTPLAGTTTMRSAQPLRKPGKDGAKKGPKRFLTSAAEPYPKKICNHWSACMHLNWRYRTGDLTKPQMVLSEFQIPSEWLGGEPDGFARATPSKTVENILKATTLHIFPSILDASHVSKLRLRKSHTGGKVMIPNLCRCRNP